MDSYVYGAHFNQISAWRFLMIIHLFFTECVFLLYQFSPLDGVQLGSDTELNGTQYNGYNSFVVGENSHLNKGHWMWFNCPLCPAVFSR